MQRRKSLSARRAWIEISMQRTSCRNTKTVALRKESVDRNEDTSGATSRILVALRKESVDRNYAVQIKIVKMHGRSPQGERG